MSEGEPYSKIRFGVFEFDPQSRELAKHGVRLKLQEQPIQVLVVLLDQAGQIVPREEIQRRLWPDGTFVDYEQSLNKAVNKLREALGDSADNPVYIETLARRGYRFVAPVERPVLVKPEAPKEAPIPERKAVRLRARLGWAAGLLTAALLVTGLWPLPVPRARVTQLTHGGRPQGGLAVHDGRILYESQVLDLESTLWSQFYSISTEGGEPRRERMPFLDPKAYAYLAAVSPRQDTILIGALAADGFRGELWLAGFDGSKPRKIGETLGGNTYSVSPDLKTLLIANRSGLLAHPVDGAPERLIARIDWNAPSDTFWHPSGERIGFISPVKKGPPKLWEVRRDGGGMRALLPEFPGEQVAASWSPDGQRLYFVSQGELYVRGGRRWLGWMRRPEPQRLTTGSVQYGLASEDPADARVVYVEGWMAHGEAMKLNRKTGVFETYLDGLSADCLDYSPDGQWIAYVSYPGRELWKCRRDGSDKVLLEDGLLTYNPRWSPDGKRLAFAAVRKDDWGQAHRIYTIAGDGGKSELVKGVNGPGFDPTWSPDGRELAYAPWDYEYVRKQDRHVSIVNLETGAVRMVPGSDEMMSARWSPDGKRLVALRWGAAPPAIYDFGTGRWADIDVERFGFEAWSRDSRYVYGLVLPNRLVRVEAATRTVEEIRTIKEMRLTGNMVPGVWWTPDAEPVVLSDMDTLEIYRIDVER